MTRILSLLGGWQGYAELALIAILTGAGGTWRVMSWREQAHQAQAVEHRQVVYERRSQITFDVGMKFEQASIVNRNATEKRFIEVENHVTPQADHSCNLTLGFVRVFNESVHGPVPGAALGTDDAPSGVALSDVAKTTVINSGQYDQVAAQLTALQDWIIQQRAVKP